MREVYNNRNFYCIVKNQVLCLNCGNTIASVQYRESVTCECKYVTIGGGKFHLYREYKDPSKAKDLSVFRKFSKEELDDFIVYYTRQRYENPLFSSNYYKTLIESAKYFRQEWYPEKFNMQESEL